jgi:hypothetical protein
MMRAEPTDNSGAHDAICHCLGCFVLCLLVVLLEDVPVCFQNFEACIPNSDRPISSSCHGLRIERAVRQSVLVLEKQNTLQFTEAKLDLLQILGMHFLKFIQLFLVSLFEL